MYFHYCFSFPFARNLRIPNRDILQLNTERELGLTALSFLKRKMSCGFGPKFSNGDVYRENISQKDFVMAISKSI